MTFHSQPLYSEMQSDDGSFDEQEDQPPADQTYAPSGQMSQNSQNTYQDLLEEEDQNNGVHKQIEREIDDRSLSDSNQNKSYEEYKEHEAKDAEMMSDDQSASDHEIRYDQDNQIQDDQQVDDYMEDEVE